MKHNFAWGDTRGIREILLQRYLDPSRLFSKQEWQDKGGYPDHAGNPELIDSLHRYLKNLVGIDYKYVFITGGATNALAASLYALKLNPEQYHQKMFTSNLYYRMYPLTAASQGYRHETSLWVSGNGAEWSDVAVVDSPSNPLGNISMGPVKNFNADSVIWDAAYFSPTYYGRYLKGRLSTPKVYPDHGIMIGSFNKLTGLNGLRVGWAATQELSVASRIFDYLEGDMCGVNSMGQLLANEFLKANWLDSFFEETKRMIDSNRQEILKIAKVMGYSSVPEDGMFAFYEIDDKLKNLFDKAGVVLTDGRTVGARVQSVRISLGNSNKDTQAMIKDFLAADSVPKR